MYFYSLLMDGTTDADNFGDELITGFQKHDSIGEVGTFAWYFSLEVPMKADADGLIECL